MVADPHVDDSRVGEWIKLRVLTLEMDRALCWTRLDLGHRRCHDWLLDDIFDKLGLVFMLSSRINRHLVLCKGLKLGLGGDVKLGMVVVAKDVGVHHEVFLSGGLDEG